MDQALLIKNFISSLIYSGIGLVIYLFGFFLVDKLTPGNLWKELIEDRNMAVAILMGSVAIGISMIISAAIHG